MIPMSGLLAFVGSRAIGFEHRAALAEALESLRHRGPDETESVVVSDSIFLGVQRLAVVDPRHGRQPLSYPADGYEAGRYRIVFDGELHNHVEIRDQLIAEFGATFATGSDTEVVVAAY